MAVSGRILHPFCSATAAEDAELHGSWPCGLWPSATNPLLIRRYETCQKILKTKSVATALFWGKKIFL